jgi:sugar lactone lactonase YvrE
MLLAVSARFPLLLLLAFRASAASVEVAAGPAQFPMIEPFGVDFDRSGNWYVVEHKGQRILRFGPGGKAAIFAGTGQVGRGGDQGPAAQATMFDPHGIAIARSSAAMYVADTRNHLVRKIDMKSGIITTVAGSGQEGFSGDGGPAVNAAFRGTFGIALAPDDKSLYIADLGNRRVRKIDLVSGIITTVSGNGERGVPADGSTAAAAPLVDPRAVAVDSRHNLYILERNGNALRVVDRAGRIRSLITPGSVSPDMKGPKHLCIGRDDSVIIADAENHLIRRYSPKDGKTVILAGTGVKGDKIDAADPLRTELNRPHGVFVSRRGDLFIADSYNHRILRVQLR